MGRSHTPRFLVTLTLVVLLAGCTPTPPTTRPPRHRPYPGLVTAVDIARIFGDHQVTGCFVLYDVRRGTTVRHNPFALGGA